MADERYDEDEMEEQSREGFVESVYRPLAANHEYCQLLHYEAYGDSKPLPLFLRLPPPVAGFLQTTRIAFVLIAVVSPIFGIVILFKYVASNEGVMVGIAATGIAFFVYHLGLKVFFGLMRNRFERLMRETQNEIYLEIAKQGPVPQEILDERSEHYDKLIDSMSSKNREFMLRHRQRPSEDQQGRD